jgi:hypothetical protein
MLRNMLLLLGSLIDSNTMYQRIAQEQGLVSIERLRVSNIGRRYRSNSRSSCDIADASNDGGCRLDGCSEHAQGQLDGWRTIDCREDAMMMIGMMMIGMMMMVMMKGERENRGKAICSGFEIGPERDNVNVSRLPFPA